MIVVCYLYVSKNSTLGQKWQFHSKYMYASLVWNGGVFLNRDDVSVMVDQRVTYHRILPSRICGKGPLRSPSSPVYLTDARWFLAVSPRIWSDYGDERYSYAMPFKGSDMPGERPFFKASLKNSRDPGTGSEIRGQDKLANLLLLRRKWCLDITCSPRLGKRDMNHRNDTQQCIQRTATYFVLMVRYDVRSFDKHYSPVMYVFFGVLPTARPRGADQFSIQNQANIRL